MNTKNNKRRRESVERIEKTFITLLQEKELQEITVADLCKSAELNRSTFYANYLDLYDLAEKLKEKLEKDFSNLFLGYDHSMHTGALTMFEHIKENQLFYKTYFKLCYNSEQRVLIYDTERARQDFDNKHIAYHIEFFRSGLNAIIKMWLDGGCRETPEEMAEIIKLEYRGR